MSAYYNEFDAGAAAWLRELIKQGLIAYGVVDERSVIDVQANELVGFSQCHFFAGIGGWSYALRLANWADTRPVWTASLPCQPFSVAGNQKGKEDERHLLPHFLELVKECRPSTIIGEQVEGAIRHGWLDDLQATMEAEDYAVGHCVLGAHSVGSPHIRQRLYWIANAINARPQGRLPGWTDSQREIVYRYAGRDSAINGVGYAELFRLNANTIRRSTDKGKVESGLLESERPGANWEDVEWIYCRDNKYRPILRGLKPVIRTVKSCTKPLVNRLPAGVVCSSGGSESIDANETQEARVMRLRGYGNAIVPAVAAEFIKAFMTVND